MKNLLLISSIGIIAILFIYFTIRKIKVKNNEIKRDISSGKYSVSHKKPHLINKLTLQQKMELSWKFLFEITEIIFSKFSSTDKQVINEIGKVLYKQGMRYQHIVDLNLTSKIEQRKSKDLEQEKPIVIRGR